MVIDLGSSPPGLFLAGTTARADAAARADAVAGAEAAAGKYLRSRCITRRGRLSGSVTHECLRVVRAGRRVEQHDRDLEDAPMADAAVVEHACLGPAAGGQGSC